MIAPEWRRIAGIHVLEDGTVGATWIAHDRDSDTGHIYDCCIFRREVLAVIAEGLNARGRWIPVAWAPSANEIVEKLLERGCSTLPEPVSDKPEMAEVVSREIEERMRTGRLRVEQRLAEWLDEYKSFYREDAKVPLKSHPLMSATRHAVAMLDWARRQAHKGKRQVNYARIAMI